MLQERIAFTSQSLQQKQEVVKRIEDAISTLTSEQDTVHRQAVVLDKLADLFGVRGVQHFIFMEVIGMLEKLANLYLQVLADGGIQLRLEEDAEGDKIVKGVTIRGADGEFRERGLSQLSGGQWRLEFSSLHMFHHANSY